MYRVDGSSDLEEEELDHLEGYCGSGPVRVGNDAATQLQLDIYGELIDAIYVYNKYGGPIYYDAWDGIRDGVDRLCEDWDQPDEGIWETRGGRKDFVFSRLQCVGGNRPRGEDGRRSAAFPPTSTTGAPFGTASMRRSTSAGGARRRRPSSSTTDRTCSTPRC